MAHKKGVGSSKNGRESESKRLGVKIFGGQHAIARKFGRKRMLGVTGSGKNNYCFQNMKCLFANLRNKNRFVATALKHHTFYFQAKNWPC